MWSRIASIILRNRLYILTIIFLLTLFFGYFVISDLRVDNRYGILLPKDHPTQMNYVKFKEQFGEDGATLVMAISSKDLYSEKKFKAWKELGDKILAQPGVETVISEATLFNIVNDTAEQKFVIHRIFYDTTFKEKSIDSIRTIIKRNPAYKNVLYNDSSEVSLMLIGLSEKVLEDKVKSKVVFHIEELTKQYEPALGKFYFSGLPHIRVTVAKRILNEMFLFLGLSVFASSLLLYIFFRSFRIVIQCNLVVFVSVIWALGTIALFNYSLTIMMALIPPLLIVIGVPNCVFIVTRYHQEFNRMGNKTKALFIMIRRIGPVTFLTNLTTAVGFVTFTSSDRLAEFGVISSLNIMVVFFLSLCIVPILASYSAPPKERHLRHLSRVYSQGFIEYIILIITRYRPIVYVLSVVMLFVGIYGMTKITATGNVTGDIPENDQISRDLKFIERNFGGSIPFEITVNYKESGKLFNETTMTRVEEVQQMFESDTLFSKSLTYLDFLKVINMSYHQGNPAYYKIIKKRDMLKLKTYFEKFDFNNVNNGNLSLKDLVDTANTTLRIRTQMKDLGSYSVAQKVDTLKLEVDALMNPEREEWERLFKKYETGDHACFDSLVAYPAIANDVIRSIAERNEALQYAFDVDPDKLYKYRTEKSSIKRLRKAIDNQYYDVTFTGISVVVSEGTKYLFINLLQSLLFAVLSIALLMAVLFRSFKIIVVSMIPNIIPLLLTAGLMGYFDIPLKPSTLLVFGIALGITVDNAILFLAKYRQELKANAHDMNYAILTSLRETGLGIFYTSVILFFGFIMFVFSQFGGTKALGLLVSITILVGMVTNLIILPSLLLSLQKRMMSKSFEEPYFEIFDEEEDYDTEKIQIEISKALGEEL
ncbi:MAG: efflux RND transporter permease subunit [Flavobacteriales bacterium]|jgi:predicted RND superfamily exporter protein